MVIFKGKKRGINRTMDIHWTHIKSIFFPKTFQQKYSYLGAMPYTTDSEYFQAVYPLVLAMDYEAKPKWCPRWFLRFLYLFGSDHSTYKIRNVRLHTLLKELTKGIIILDWKVKYSDYDIRLSVIGPKHIVNLAEGIEHKFYEEGYKKELLDKLKSLDPNANVFNTSIVYLEKRIKELESEDKSIIQPS